jgi:hypothetical protein
MMFLIQTFLSSDHHVVRCCYRRNVSSSTKSKASGTRKAHEMILKKPLAGVFLAFIKRQSGRREKEKAIDCPLDSGRDIRLYWVLLDGGEDGVAAAGRRSCSGCIYTCIGE